MNGAADAILAITDEILNTECINRLYDLKSSLPLRMSRGKYGAIVLKHRFHAVDKPWIEGIPEHDSDLWLGLVFQGNEPGRLAWISGGFWQMTLGYRELGRMLGAELPEIWHDDSVEFWFGRDDVSNSVILVS